MTHKSTQPTTEATETELSYSSMLKKIHEHLDHQNTRWTEIYNQDRHTDAGTSLRSHAQGRITAYVELRAFLLELEKNEN